MSARLPSGPLVGVRVIEMSGKGPAPFCAMLLADMGADVIRIDRPTKPGRAHDNYVDPQLRGRRSVAINLKSSQGVETVLKLVEQADALIEGFRPGVMERLGLGPENCKARNAKLVYGRVTGWGQDGPLAGAAGHDLNYIALTGALHAIGNAGKPPPAPLALIGDFGGGGTFLAIGVLAAVLEARSSGLGQVIDAAMLDGVNAMLGFTRGLHAAGWWIDERESNLFDGGAHMYANYETKDGKAISIAPIEVEFYDQFMEIMDIDPTEMPARMDRTGWPQWKKKLAAVFKEKTRDQWCAILEGTDVCFAPVLTMGEAPDHPHNHARKTFVQHEGVTQPAPAPRFSRTPSAIQGPSPKPGEHTAEVLSDWGLDDDTVAELVGAGAVGIRD